MHLHIVSVPQPGYDWQLRTEHPTGHLPSGSDSIQHSLQSVCSLRDLQALVEEGKIKYVGLSEVSADDLRQAHKVHPITAVQLEWSLWTRDAEV